MVLRYASLLLLAVAHLLAAPSAHAQLTLTRANYPLSPGSFSYTGHSTENEDESQTSAIQALIAQEGTDQTWDFRALTLETVLSGDATITEGATGPGADLSPLDEATLTVTTPFLVEEEGEVIEGTSYAYLSVSDDAAYQLGLFVDGTFGEDEVEIAYRNTPSGALIAAFPYAYGDTWTSSYTESFEIDGTTLFTSPVTQTYEVDGWGTLIGPDVEEGVPVLRVKLTEERTVFGVPSTTVSYEFHSSSPVQATIFAGEDGIPPSASFSTFSAVTSVEPGNSPISFLLEAPSPNPSPGFTSFALMLPEAGHVRVAVYDMLGREVALLADEVRPAGRHPLTFEGRGLAGGVYVIHATAGAQRASRRVTLLR